MKREENGLEVYLMAEIPSNIVLADEFAQHTCNCGWCLRGTFEERDDEPLVFTFPAR